jgi:NAD(P)-dependent dehydrogenase (short-subunit alcohol dehydrogenase family)
VLRIEAVAHNTRELNCGRSLEKFPDVVSRLKAMLERFADALSCIDQCFIADDMIEHLPLASQVRSVLGAGSGKAAARVADSTDDDWRGALERNLIQTVRTMRLALPHMKDRPGTAVINVYRSLGGPRSWRCLANTARPRRR